MISLTGFRCQGDGPGVFLVDVVCDCGANNLINQANDQASFKHRIQVGEGQSDTDLVCSLCGRTYKLHPQGNHFHVLDTTETSVKKMPEYSGGTMAVLEEVPVRIGAEPLFRLAFTIPLPGERPTRAAQTLAASLNRLADDTDSPTVVAVMVVKPNAEAIDI